MESGNHYLQNQAQDKRYENEKLEKELQVRTRRIAELIEVGNMHQENFDT
jgi:hypothetical protein